MFSLPAALAADARNSIQIFLVGGRSPSVGVRVVIASEGLREQEAGAKAGAEGGTRLSLCGMQPSQPGSYLIVSRLTPGILV